MEKDIPHGHGLSYKKGICDGLMGETKYSNLIHETHRLTYNKGVEEGKNIKESISSRVKE